MCAQLVWSSIISILNKAENLLADLPGVSIDSTFHERLTIYSDLITQWNPLLGLVSSRDINFLLEHIVDSLSLFPYLPQGPSPVVLMDIGSGGGFPAIPLKIAFPELHLILYERKESKVTFLKSVVHRLSLNHVEFRQESFPSSESSQHYGPITARAVERPGILLEPILSSIAVGSSFLCQFPPDLLKVAAPYTRVEIRDEWSRCGLRRGNLSLISLQEPTV